jgi:hypothetical protein
MNACTNPGCTRAFYAKGACKRHYSLRWLENRPGYSNMARAKYRNAHPDKMRANRRTLSGRFSSGKTQAKQTGRNWTLSLSEYTVLLSRPCHWCGGGLNETGSGLDRLDNSGGYTHGNVVPSCRSCNLIKGRIESLGFKFPRTVELMRELRRAE